ncbi:MAG: M48 family metalloprotease [Steroidobacteraceae bacterium]
MQYFRRQLEARQLSRRLVLLFALGVLCVTVAISAVMLTLAATLSNGWFLFRFPDIAWLQQHPAAVISTMTLVSGVMAMAVLLKRIELREGGGAVARSLGGERITADSRDPQQRRLHNIVEEMSIAAGIALPEVYFLPREAGINAFAAGLTSANAVITVTRGALELLSRDELQGVVAHEFSHIVNEDIRLNMHLIAWLHGLMALSAVGRGMLNLAPRDQSGNRRGLPMIWAAAWAIVALGYVGLLFGRLMQAAVARHREALADASAVQFTRNPAGLRGALIKSAAVNGGASWGGVDSEVVTHMLFFSADSRWFATHPPLAERIRELGASFDVAELNSVRQQLLTRSPAISNSEDERPAAQPESLPAVLPLLSNIRMSMTEITAHAAGTGVVLPLARQLRISLPAELVTALMQSEGAIALFFALALTNDMQQRLQQLQYLRSRLPVSTVERVVEQLATTDALNALQRQPALLRLLPQLRQLPEAQRLLIGSCLNGLPRSPGQLSVTQYALHKLAQGQLHDAFAEH